VDSSLFIGLLIGVIAGLAIGVGAAMWFQRKQVDSKTTKQIQKEHQAFREQVADHFVETAGLVNRLTDSYKEVFEHLQGGAQKLVDAETLQDKLPQIDEETVTLRRIGARQDSTLNAEHSDTSEQE